MSSLYITHHVCEIYFTLCPFVENGSPEGCLSNPRMSDSTSLLKSQNHANTCSPSSVGQLDREPEFDLSQEDAAHVFSCLAGYARHHLTR